MFRQPSAHKVVMGIVTMPIQSEKYLPAAFHPEWQGTRFCYNRPLFPEDFYAESKHALAMTSIAVAAAFGGQAGFLAMRGGKEFSWDPVHNGEGSDWSPVLIEGNSLSVLAGACFVLPNGLVFQLLGHSHDTKLPINYDTTQTYWLVVVDLSYQHAAAPFEDSDASASVTALQYGHRGEYRFRAYLTSSADANWTPAGVAKEARVGAIKVWDSEAKLSWVVHLRATKEWRKKIGDFIDALHTHSSICFNELAVLKENREFYPFADTCASEVVDELRQTRELMLRLQDPRLNGLDACALLEIYFQACADRHNSLSTLTGLAVPEGIKSPHPQLLAKSVGIGDAMLSVLDAAASMQMRAFRFRLLDPPPFLIDGEVLTPSVTRPENPPYWARVRTENNSIQGPDMDGEEAPIPASALLIIARKSFSGNLVTAGTQNKVEARNRSKIYPPWYSSDDRNLPNPRPHGANWAPGEVKLLNSKTPVFIYRLVGG